MKCIGLVFGARIAIVQVVDVVLHAAADANRDDEVAESPGSAQKFAQRNQINVSSFIRPKETGALQDHQEHCLLCDTEPANHDLVEVREVSSVLNCVMSSHKAWCEEEN